MKRNRKRTDLRSVLSRGVGLTEQEIAADLHFPVATKPRSVNSQPRRG